jgi:hypothetical protein
MVEKLKSRLKENILVIYLLILFIIDVLNKFDFADFFPWSIILKLGKFIFYFYFLSLIFLDKKLIKIRWSLGIFVLIFIFNQYFLHRHFSLGETISEPFLNNIRLFILLLFPIIFSSYLSEKLKNYSQFKKIEKVYIILILIATICVIIGLIWNIKFFKTYSTRFGYDGIMPKSITASYFFISSIVYFYYSFVIKKRTEFKWLLILILGASSLIGTKAIYTFLFLLLAYHIIHFKLYKNLLLYVISGFGLISILVLRNELYELLKRHFTPLIELYEKNGLLTSLLSIRDQIFQYNISIYNEKWEWWNILIGGRVPELKLFENSLLDLISFVGLIGMFIYLKIIQKNLFNSHETNDNFINFSIISIFIISMLAGQFFLNISGITYVLLTIFLMKYLNNSESKTTSMKLCVES